MKTKFLRNFALGCFTGAFIALSLAWLLDETVSTALQKNWIYLVSAGVTLLAASLALLGTFSVIENQNKLAKEENEKSLLAARAALPPVLSSLYQKCSNAFEISDNQLEVRRNEKMALRLLSELELSSKELKALTECIKHADADTARWLSLIISHFQIAQARLNRHLLNSDLYADPLEDNYQSVAYRAVDWLEIKALVSHVFDFARTGNLPATGLDTSKISLPIDNFGTGPTARYWDHTYENLMDHYDENGGTSSFGFQQRLLSNPLISNQPSA